jgi:hypothetical protein
MYLFFLLFNASGKGGDVAVEDELLVRGREVVEGKDPEGLLDVKLAGAEGPTASPSRRG